LAGQGGGNMWCEYFHAEPADCVFDPEKDIAYKVVIHDSVSRKRWTDSIKEIAVDFMKAGAPFFDSYDKAKELIGEEPVTVSWGVVFSSENFSAAGKVEKFDRHERAKKRGEKLCLRKRFPRIHLPEPENFDDQTIDAEDFKVVMEEPEHKSLNQPVSQSMRELGFDSGPDWSEQAPEEPVSEVAPKKVTPTDYWNESNKKFNNDHEKGKALLEKHGGDLDAAYHELTKK